MRRLGLACASKNSNISRSQTGHSLAIGGPALLTQLRHWPRRYDAPHCGFRLLSERPVYLLTVNTAGLYSRCFALNCTGELTRIGAVQAE